MSAHARWITAAALLWTLGCPAALRAGEEEFKDVKETRAVENYVPYDEFLKLTGKDPNATVMTLDEYRNLVALATARNAPRAAVLPPVATSLMGASYTGQAGDFSVRFTAHFEFVAAADGWTRCDLGPLQNLSGIVLDGHPGWIVLENGRATLLVKGRGAHAGTLSFALPLTTEDDVQRLAARLLNAATGRVTLTVPGRALPSTDAGPIDAVYDPAADATTFSFPVLRAANNEAPALAVRWERKYDSQKNDALLECEHHVSYLLNPASPYFYWQASVQIARRKTSELAFIEPPGCRVVRLAGTGVHSWFRDNGVLRVLLDKPELGELSLAASGVLDIPAGNFVLGAPELQGARRNSRTLALYEPPGMHLTPTQTAGLRELALDERPALSRFKLPDWDGRLARNYFVEQPGVKVGVNVSVWPAVFDTRTAALLNIGEQNVQLRCAIAVLPERGRVFSVNLAVPPEWKLSDLRERGTGRGLRLAQRDEGQEDNWTLRFGESADLAHPFEVDLLFVPRDLAWAESPWSAHDLSLTLPTLSGARRSVTHIGLDLHPSIDLALGDMPAWRSDMPGTLARLGVNDNALRAGLASETPGAALQLKLTHAAPRGEYESVLHVLTLEREVWLRADVRVLALERARAVDELTLELPAGVKEPLYITGTDVREIAPGAQPSQRIVRFEKPWRNVRLLRVEHRAPLAAETDVPIPDVRILGNFDGRRRIVFQSAGVVSLDVKPGGALLAASLDDTPYFAAPFKMGRALFAYTFTPGADAGTFRTRNLESLPVLENLVKNLNLVTVLDASGVARTHAEIILAYSRQYLEAQLPPGAKLLTLCVEGESARPVQGGGADTLKIPLPPKSAARVELVYEQSAGALGSFGRVAEIAPEFDGFPVLDTAWSIYYPNDYAVETAGGNMTALVARQPRFFATEFFGAFAEGVLPTSSAWSAEQRETAVGPESAGIDAVERGDIPSSSKALQSVEAAAARPPLKNRAIGGLAIPEGAVLKAGKLGGSARLVLAYRSLGYSAFARRSVFLGAMLIGFWLMLRVSFRRALAFTAAGLLLGTLLPLALNWESPLLAIPFCEGLAAFALLLGAAYLSHALKWLLRRRSRTELAAACLAVALLASVPHSHAAEPEPVLIPYAKEGTLPSNSNPKDTKVYVPKSVYLELMKQVHPEPKEPAVDAPKTLASKPAIVPLALGNATYELSVDAANYFIKGTLEATTYDPKGWATLPLDLGPTQLVSLKIDNQPAGVSNLNGKPFVELKGAHTFHLELELRGPLELQAGRARLTAQVVPGGATRLVAVLPDNVEVDAKALPAGAWISKDAAAHTQRCEFALGAAGSVALSWNSPDIHGTGQSRLSSHSYTQFALGADGYAVACVERLGIDGAPVDQLSFHVLGDWEVAAVSAPGLAEWTVSGAGAAKILRLWYHKPVGDSTVAITGWAPLDAAAAPAAGLSLDNAVRQEGYIGLKHGEDRRFSARTLDNLKRASQEELAAAVALPSNTQPDRILHYNGAPANQLVAAEPEPSDTTLDTQFAGIVRDGTLAIGARVRYTVTGRGALRYQVELPRNWNIRTVRATALRDWEVVDGTDENVRFLVVHLNTRAVTGTEIRWSAEMPLTIPAQGALRLELPQPRALVDSKMAETIDWILAARSAFSLSQNDATTMQPVPVERARRWIELDDGQDWRLAFRSSKAGTKLVVDVSRQDSALYATVVSFVSAAEEHVQIVARIRYRIERAGRERFALKLPPGAELLSVDGKNIRGRDLVPAPDGAALTVFMQSPVAGEQLIDLAYRLPREPGRDAVARPPSIEDAGARGVEHYAGLLPSEDILSETRLLNPIKDAEALPFVPEHISKQALTKIFAGEQGWSMTLRRTGLKAETGQAAEVRAEIVTAIATDGGVRSSATYLVRNRTLQFLPVELPADARLWTVLVEGRPASVSRRGANVLLIPLQRLADTDTPARVQIVYESAPAALPALYTSFTPRAPKVLDAPVIETHWRIYAPEEYDVSRTGGNVQEVVSGVLYSSRVDSAVGEITRLARIADAPEQNPTRRKRALQSIAGQQQELNDNITALGNENGNAGVDEDARRLSRDDLQAQMRYNDTNFRTGNAIQSKLNEAGRKKQLEDAMSNTLDPEQIREFFDHYNFLNVHWRDGERIKKGPPTAPRSPDDMTLEDLSFMRRFAGYHPGELPPPPPAQPPALNETPPPASGLSEKQPGQILVEASTGGFEINEKRVSDLRMTRLNFRSVEAHPELTLSFRSRLAPLRGLAAGLLAALALAAYVLAASSMRRAKTA